jgi:hypothetical protein
MPLPDAQKVADLWRESDRALSEERRNYWLNTAFYLGQQWVWWDTQRGIVQLQADRASDTDRARTTINRIRPSIDSLMGRLASRNLGFEAQVSGVDDVTIRGGRLAEFICEHERVERDWEVARVETIFNCLMGGTAGIFAEWDTQAGDIVATDPDNGTPLHLVTYYERPSGNEPGGVLTIIEDKIVAQAEQWPYPFPYLPVRSSAAPRCPSSGRATRSSPPAAPSRWPTTTCAPPSWNTPASPRTPA